jgi:DeoR family transcriptional regulator of aga operon
MALERAKRQNERQVEILQILLNRQSASVSELAQDMGVSEATLRRNLRMLVETGVVERHAGCVMLSSGSEGDLPLILRASQHRQEKLRIAKMALSLVKNNETVFISGGTTTIELARLLPGQCRLTVITNSLSVACVLVDKPGITLVVLGGEVRPTEQTMHGHLTELGAKQLRTEKLFYGVEAISAQFGVSHSQLKEVSTDRALADAAEKIIVLADHSKLGKFAPAVIVPISRVHQVVTGREAPEEILEALRAQGVEVILA